jgi:hypothetical protein
MDWYYSFSYPFPPNQIIHSSVYTMLCSAGIGVIGALSFVISDSLLAYNRFAHPIAGAKYGVMITYYTAQLLIAASTYGGTIITAPHDYV